MFVVFIILCDIFNKFLFFCRVMFNCDKFMIKKVVCSMLKCLFFFIEMII